jgi:hypothetical protein
MANIFALQGPQNCGKSDTLKHLFQMIQTKYASATIQNLHPKTKDIAIIMHGVNGLVVGIESQGDPNSRLQNTLNNFSAANCDIIFCACRTTGGTVKSIQTFSNAYNIQFVKKIRVANNHSATNTSIASSLMQLAGI